MKKTVGPIHGICEHFHNHDQSRGFVFKMPGEHVGRIVWCGCSPLTKGDRLYPNGMISAAQLVNGVILTMCVWIDLIPHGLPIFIANDSDQVDFSIESLTREQIEERLFPLGEGQARRSFENLCRHEGLKIDPAREASRKIEMFLRPEAQERLERCMWEHQELELNEAQGEQELCSQECQELLSLLQRNGDVVRIVQSTIDRVEQERRSLSDH